MKQPMKKGSFVPKNVPGGGGVGVGWGGSCRGGVGHAGVEWGGVGCVMQGCGGSHGWGGSCRAGVGHVGSGVGHVGVGWVM